VLRAGLWAKRAAPLWDMGVEAWAQGWRALARCPGSWGSVVGGVGLLYRSGVQLGYVLLYRTSRPSTVLRAASGA